KPVVEKIEFEGNKSLRDGHLKKEMSSREGEMLDENRLSRDIVSIKRFYGKKGFHLARIDYSVQVNKKKNTATITIVVDEKGTVKIKRIFMEGNEHFSDKTILRLITTRADALFTSGFFDENTFMEDMEKIKFFYQNKGYLDILVDSDLAYYNDSKNMDVTIIIDEGKKYLVGDIYIRQNTVFGEQNIKDVIELTRNKPFSQDLMRLDAVKIQEIYYTAGYILCRVYPEPLVSKDTGRIDITYTINEDKLIYVNRVEIAGNTKTKDAVIRRELRIYPGEAFNGQDIKRSKERLYNLGYFEEVSFDTKETGDPAERDLVVNVKETQTGEFSFGGGYSSIDRIIGFASVTQRNFDILNFPTFTGGGQNLTVRGEFGFVRTNYFVSWTDPWIFGYPYLFGFDLYRTSHSRDYDAGYGWEEERWGGSVRGGKEFTDWLRADATYRLDRVTISDILDEVITDINNEEGTNYLSALAGYLTFDTRDNVFNPKRGLYLRGGIENAGGFLLGDINYLKGSSISKYYISFVDQFVVELKVRGGLVTDYGDSDTVPIYERFYAGGTGSIRGYSERGVGPRDRTTGIPIGGESMLVGNVELTFPIFQNMIKGAIFYDVGNVWADVTDIMSGGDYAQGAGIGIRVKTPIGPVKLDWGYPLREIDEEEQKGRFYFSMSHGF
ncbi:MAG: outer membrane protein assembly factor BamA, partial [Candidatus Omnitrophota bacterium]